MREKKERKENKRELKKKRVLREQNERELKKKRVLREQNEREEQERREEERLEREKKLEKERKNKEFWYGLSGLDTENELNNVFEKLGFETELTPLSNDEGLDHILDGEIVVQTKNQQRKVSRPDLQKFWGSWKDTHKKGIFVSINGFTVVCEEFVKDKPNLLYDVDDVIGMSEGKKPEWKDSSNKDSEGS